MNRNEILMSLIDPQGLGLEVGPGFNPLLPKSKGFRVETLDHASQADLIKKYEGVSGVDVSRIEPVDYVSTGGSVYEPIGEQQRYDFIVASHVIEHTVDLLGFLIDCERLLKPSGALILAVPDKRFSFDVLRPLSSTGEILQAHLDKRARHSPGRVFDEIAYNVTRAGQIAWSASDRADISFFRSIDDAVSVLQDYQSNEAFIDIHSWLFTPSSFRLAVNDLNCIGLLKLREKTFHTGLGGEFIVRLSLSGSGPGMSRIDLAKAVFEELRDIRF